MPIGIDYTPAYEQGGGIGRYVRELVAALAEYDAETPYRLFVAGANRKPLPTPPGPNFSYAPCRLTPDWLARLWHRARLPIPVEWWTGPLRLYHATDFTLPPVRRGAPTLLTVHDLSFVRVPGAASPSLKAYLDRVVPRSVYRADHVLADSQATKDDLVALYRTPPEKVTVLLSGVHARFRPTHDATLRARYGIGERPFVLAVGTVQPRKNYERLMRALAGLPDSLSEVQLVIAGGRGWLEGPIYAAVEALGLRDRVHFIGFAADEDLPALYTAARCLAFPSLYEGFGLPILEAMACGAPVLTSNVSSLVEVAGDAAVLVDPHSEASIRDGLARILTDDSLRERLVADGFRQAAAFTWARAAAHLRDLYARFARPSR
ncbi:MAG: glycosyltransferase family 4 protein [Anaerolineae bacterium]|nr:glycosyltransferase family 4 protein [Anaerolineae bacterium]